MYAIIRTGGRQYRVEQGRYLDVDKLPYDEGEEIIIDDVLLIHDGENAKIGQPTVEGASIKATVMKQWRGKKIIVFKYRQRTNYRRKGSHRIHYTRLMINQISIS